MSAREHDASGELRDFPVALFASVQDEIHAALRLCEGRIGVDLSEAWAITATRFLPLHRALADPITVAGLEEDLVAAGLYGRELQLRVLLFTHVVRASESTVAQKLGAAAALLRAIDRLPTLAATVAPVADLCDLMIAVVGNEP